MKQRRKSIWFKHFDFMLIDLACGQIAFILAYIWRSGLNFPYSETIYRNIAILMIVLQICIVFFTESYSGVLRRGYLKEFQASIKHSSVLLAMILVLLFMIQLSGSYSRIILFLFWGLNCIITYIGRVTYKTFLKKRNRKNMEHMYLVTTKSLADKVVSELASGEYSNFDIKGIVILDKEIIGKKICGIPVVAGQDTMLDFLKTNVVDEIFIALNNTREKVNELTHDFLEMGITVHINIDTVSANLPNTVVKKFRNLTAITTSVKTMTPLQRAMKRFMDICGGVVGLVITGLAFIIVAPIIYKQSPGPIFFTQERVGKNGRKFKMYKFRSMYMDAEERKKELMKYNKMDGLMFKMDNDPRVTPIGKIIRKFSIDELPQFYNVLKGDMSLVGTRPPTVEEYTQYKIHHKKRLAIRPGLTGVWQVSGRSDITDFEKIVAMDAKYIEEWNFGLDIKILLKTVAVVFGKKGSY